MGIKDFFKYIKENHPEILHEVSYHSLSYKRGAVDMMNVLYMCKARSQDKWIGDVLEFVNRLRNHYIHPVCIFDGSTHPLKIPTTTKRRDTRVKYTNRVLALQESLNEYIETRRVDQTLEDFISSRPHTRHVLSGKPKVQEIQAHIKKQLDQYSISFTLQELNCVKRLIELMGVQVLTANYDGEALCASLNKEGQVDFVLSNDSDVFMFGAETVLCKFTPYGGYLVNRQELLECLDLSEAEFLKACIVSGTDFNENMKGVRFTTAVKNRVKRNTISAPFLKTMEDTLLEISDSTGHTVLHSSLTPDDTEFEHQCLVCNVDPQFSLTYPVSELVFEDEE